MPELYTDQVRAEQLQAGTDRIVRIDGARVGILTRVSKTKWTEILLDTQEVMRVENMSLICVERERKTAAELEAEKLDALLRWLDRTERAGINQLADARDKAATALLNGEAVTGWNLLDVVRAQATHALWERVRRASAYQVNRPEEEQLTRVQVVENVRREVQQRLLDHTQLTSRSTSQASNLVEDAEREAQLHWLRDTRGLAEL